MVIYRDRKGGRFVKKSTWTRSKKRGGTRYVRKTVKAKKLARPEREKAIGEEEISEIQGGFDTA